jgi:hypothetical protein
VSARRILESLGPRRGTVGLSSTPVARPSVRATITARAFRVAFVRFVIAAFAFVLAFRGERLAFADDALVAPAPHDAPLVLQPAGIHIPPLPEGYTSKSLGWIRFGYPARAEERVAPVIAQTPAMRAQLEADLGQSIEEGIEVRIAPSFEEMAKLAPEEIPPPAYASGVAYPSLRLVLLTMTAPGSHEGVDLVEVFHHELAHIALDDAVRGHHVPRWFNEGFAVHASGESRVARLKALWDATLSKTLLPLEDLDKNFPVDRVDVNTAYAQSADFVRFLLSQSDRPNFARTIDRVRAGQPFDAALADAYRTSLRKLEFEWHEQLDKRFSTIPALTAGSIVWVALIGILIAAYVKRRRRSKAVLERWEREERAADEALARARAAAAAALADEAGVPAPHVLSRPSGQVPMVEHDGTWHTLH